MSDFGAQLQAFARKTGRRLEQVDLAIKLSLFNRVLANTRVDKGRLRGNWQVSTGIPAAGEIERLNPAAGLTPDEISKIQPFSNTILTNNLAYARVWDENDAIISRAIADARAQLARLVADT